MDFGSWSANDVQVMVVEQHQKKLSTAFAVITGLDPVIQVDFKIMSHPGFQTRTMDSRISLLLHILVR